MNINATTLFSETIVDKFNWKESSDQFFYADNGWHSTFVYGAMLYLPTTYLLKQLMANRDPVPSSLIKPILLLWNIWMMGFSLAGAFYTLPQLYQQLNQHNWSLRSQVCDHTCYEHPAAMWVFLFNITKMMEWTDTVFLIIQKKPVIFLHWFHHICTMLYCWHATLYSAHFDCSGWWFASMNLFVHTIMYAYYGIRSIYSMRGKRFTLFSPLYITILQIVQMVVGVYVTMISYVRCEATRTQNTNGVLFAGAMYSVYFYLFFKLFTQKKKSIKKAKKV